MNCGSECCPAIRSRKRVVLITPSIMAQRIPLVDSFSHITLRYFYQDSCLFHTFAACIHNELFQCSRGESFETKATIEQKFSCFHRVVIQFCKIAFEIYFTKNVDSIDVWEIPIF